MKNALICLAILALTACGGPAAEPCLAPGQPGKILAINAFNGVSNDEKVELRITTDNKTIRVCSGRKMDSTLLHVGDVITGFRGDVSDNLYYTWVRVR